MARRKGRRRRKETNHKSNIQLACERLEARQLLAGDLFTSLGAMALPGPGSLPADTSDFGGEPSTAMAEVASMDDFSQRADGMGDRAACAGLIFQLD